MAGLDIAKLAQRLADLNKGNENKGSSMSFIDIKDGKNMIRILPPFGKAEWAVEAWVHYGVGKDAQNTKGTMIVCPKTADEKAYCPVCELSSHYKKLSKKKDDAHDKEARQIYRKKRVYYNAIDRSDNLSKYEFGVDPKDSVEKWINTETGEPESPVKVLGTGVEIYKSLIGFIIDPDYGDITDAEDGLDVNITKTGSGQFNTKYETKTARKNSPIGYDDWKTAMNDLSSLATPKSVEDIEAIMEGKTPGTPGADKTDGKPTDISDPEYSEPDNKDADATESDEDATNREIKEALARRKAAAGK